MKWEGIGVNVDSSPLVRNNTSYTCPQDITKFSK